MATWSPLQARADDETKPYPLYPVPATGAMSTDADKERDTHSADRLDRCYGDGGLCDEQNCRGDSYCMCCSVMFCNSCAVTQIWAYSYAASKGACQTIGLTLAILTLVYYAIGWGQDTMTAAATVGSVVSIAVFILHLMTRFQFRAHNSKGTNTYLDGWCDCLAVFFCGPCSLCQLFRLNKLAEAYRNPWQFLNKPEVSPV